MKSLSKRLSPLVLFTAAVVAVACSEQLNGGAACPALCPNPPATLRDTTFDAIDLDTSIAGFPTFGLETRLFVATFGDTLETAAIIRFDSLLSIFRRVGTVDDSEVVFVDTGAFVQFAIGAGDTLGAPTTIELYNVDMDGAEDVDPLAVTAAFTPARLIGSRTVPADSLRDSVRVPIDPAFLLSRIQADSPSNRVRVGVHVTQAGNPRLTIVASQGGGIPKLVFRPAPDSAAPELSNLLFSKSPADFYLASALADYLVVLRSPAPPAGDVFRVGGLPGRRAYLRFNIPASILDSSNVVRATLFLTQRPSVGAPRPQDTVGVGHFGVVAGTAITDLSRALGFLQRLRNKDTLQVLPTDSAERSFEIIDWIRAWRGSDPAKTPRALGFSTLKEGEDAGQVDFFSLEAPAGVRPRLRLTYLPNTVGALP